MRHLPHEPSKSRLLIALAMAGLAGPGAAATFNERMDPQDVDLATIAAKPQAYQNMRLRFACVFVEWGNIYDPLHTQFKAERYCNVVVWDDDATVWDPQVRAQPVMTLYIDRKLASDSSLASLKRFDVLELTAEIANHHSGIPWMEIHQIRKLPNVGTFTDSAVYHVQQGNAAAAESAHDLAEQHFATALKDDLPAKGRAAVTELRARNLMAAGRHGDALAILESALDRDGSRPPGLRYLAAKCQSVLAENAPSGRREELLGKAVEHARAVALAQPDNGDAYAVLGIALAGLGDFDAARRECARAIRLQPGNAEIRWYLGRILDQQGHHAEAIEALKKAIDLTPKDARMHAAIGAAYFHRGQKGSGDVGADFGAALREYDIAIRLAPTEAPYYVASGEILEAAAAAKMEVPSGASKQTATSAMAIERYKAAVQADRAFLPAHMALVRRHQADGNTAEAGKHLQAAAELAARSVENALMIAGFQIELGQKEAALQTMEKAHAMQPGNIEASLGLIRLNRELGNVQAALGWCDRALKQHEKSAALHIEHAETFLAAGKPREAVDAAEEAVRHSRGGERTKADEVLGRARAAKQAAK